MTYYIGICLGFRAWNFLFEAKLYSGGVHPRLLTMHEANPPAIAVRQAGA
jgi:hypothetical protein